MMSEKGWVKLHRTIQDHWLWNNDSAFDFRSAWQDLIMMMNFKDRKFQMGQEIVFVPRGARITSERKLSEKWKWSRTKVRNFLELLKGDNMIEIEKTTKRTMIKVCNYDLYQNQDTNKKTSKEPDEDQTSTTQEPREDTNKNAKNVGEGENETSLNVVDDVGAAENFNLISQKYQELIGEILTPTHYQALQAYLKNGIEEEVIILALQQANFQGVRKFAYVRGILNGWYSLGIKTALEARKNIEDHEKANIAKNKNVKGAGFSDNRKVSGSNSEEEGCEYERFFKE